jgi:H/ACA ribonucleoprotein complex non-core subunit NAF1
LSRRQTHLWTHTNVEAKTDDAGDAEFLAAATALKDNPEAEFEYDSSPEESSSDSSSSDDSDSDDEIEAMDAETLGKILMAEDGDGKADANYQPRTQNEVDIVFPKPDLTITPEMNTSLGMSPWCLATTVLRTE